jgi:hypothetical protein
VGVLVGVVIEGVQVGVGVCERYFHSSHVAQAVGVLVGVGEVGETQGVGVGVGVVGGGVAVKVTGRVEVNVGVKLGTGVKVRVGVNVAGGGVGVTETGWVGVSVGEKDGTIVKVTGAKGVWVGVGDKMTEGSRSMPF